MVLRLQLQRKPSPVATTSSYKCPVCDTEPNYFWNCLKPVIMHNLCNEHALAESRRIEGAVRGNEE